MMMTTVFSVYVIFPSFGNFFIGNIQCICIPDIHHDARGLVWYLGVEHATELEEHPRVPPTHRPHEEMLRNDCVVQWPHGEMLQNDCVVQYTNKAPRTDRTCNERTGSAKIIRIKRT
jgi:hypothetical protein